MFSAKALFPVFIAINLMFAGLIYVMFKNDRSARHWMLGCLCAALGFFLITMRGTLPFWMTFELANSVLLVAWFLFASSLEVMLKGTAKILRWSFFLGLPYLIGLSLLHGMGYISYLGIYASLAWAVINSFIFFAIHKLNADHQNKYVSFIAYLYLCTGAVWFSRIFLAKLYGFHFADDASFANWVTILANILLFIMRQLTYLGARFSFISEEKEQVEKLLVEREVLVGSLLRANKTSETGALSVSIAHELSQPLHASNINIQLLKIKFEKGEINEELFKKTLSSLEADNQRASKIVKTLRSMFSNRELKSSDLLLAQSIDSVLEVIKPELEPQNIQLVLKLDEGLKIRANPSEIEQVILNFATNAIYALANSKQSKRQLTIEAYKKNSFVYFSLSDNGDGVHDQAKASLFELSNSTKKTGMGLGLWLCKQIIVRHNGRIIYEDVKGGGAKFIFCLPAIA